MSVIDLNDRARAATLPKDPEDEATLPERVKVTRMSDAFTTADQMITRGPQANPLRTGFDELDRGLRRLGLKEFTMLGADSGIGKSTIATQMALHVANSGHGVVYLNLEMSEEMYGLRTAANFVQIPTQRVASHDLNPAEHSKLAQGFSTLFGPAKRIALGNRKDHRTVPAIKKFVADAASVLALEGYPLKLVIVDHILQVIVNAKGDKDAEGKARSDLLKDLAETQDVHVIGLVHITRDASKAGSMPTKNELASSAWFDRDADNILIFHQKRNSSDGTFARGPAILSCQKARWGSPFAVELEYQKGFFYPWSLETRQAPYVRLARAPSSAPPTSDSGVHEVARQYIDDSNPLTDGL